MDVSGLSDRAGFSTRCEVVLNTFFLISLEIGSSRGSSDWGSFASGPRQCETWPEFDLHWLRFANVSLLRMGFTRSR